MSESITPISTSQDNAPAAQAPSNATSEEAHQELAAPADDAAIEAGDGSEVVAVLFQLTVQLPAPSKHTVVVPMSTRDTLQELRQLLMDTPATCHYTSYDLYHNGHKLPEYVELCNIIPTLANNNPNATLTISMANVPYDLRTCRLHVRRLLDVIARPPPIPNNITTAANGKGDTTLAQQQQQQQLQQQQQYDNLSVTEAKLTSKLNSVLGSASAQANHYSIESFLEALDDVPSAYTSQSYDTALPAAFHGFGVSISGWGPVTRHRALFGDLLYLDVSFPNGKQHCITACTQGYYINGTQDGVFDAGIDEQYHTTLAHCLLDTLSRANNQFANLYNELLKASQARDVLETFTVPFPPHRWIKPIQETTVYNTDRAMRAIDDLYVGDLSGPTRDWNEEFQCVSALPSDTLDQRLLRDRALFKFNCDFADAARVAGEAIIDGIIPPMNPMDPYHQQVFVHQNIFFSRSFDWLDYSRDQPKLNDASRTAAQERHALGDTAITDTPYTRANCDLQGVIHINRMCVSELFTVATSIVDYRGHRLVAQGIIPGILQGDKGSKLVYGSMSPNTRIHNDESFDSKMATVAEALYFARRPILQPQQQAETETQAASDGQQGAKENAKENQSGGDSAEEVLLYGPVDCKGLIASDGRQYILDVSHITPRDLNFGPEEYSERYSSHVFRPTMVNRFMLHCLQQAISEKFPTPTPEATAANTKAETPAAPSDTKGEGEGEGALSESNKASEAQKSEQDTVAQEEAKQQTEKLEFAKAYMEGMRLNVNILSGAALGGTQDQQRTDLDLIKQLSQFVLSHAIPALIKEFSAPEQVPVDGEMLTECLHHHGINLRYLGHIHAATDKDYIRDLCMLEAVTRCAKHILRRYLRTNPPSTHASTIAEFITAFASVLRTPDSSSQNGTSQTTNEVTQTQTTHTQSNGTAKGKKGGKSKSNKQHSTLATAPVSRPTAKDVWDAIARDIPERFGLTLNVDALRAFHPMACVRSLCTKTGVSIVPRDYSKANSLVFHGGDVSGVFSLVKDMQAVCSDAGAIISEGKRQAMVGHAAVGREILNEALGILYQCSPMQPQVCECHTQLASINFSLGDALPSLSHQAKALLVTQRIRGPDSYETARCQFNLGLFNKWCDRKVEALYHISQAYYITRLVHHKHHPESISVLLHMALLEMDVRPSLNALELIDQALEITHAAYPSTHLQVSVVYHTKATMLYKLGDHREAIALEKKSLEVLRKNFEEDDQRVQDSHQHIRLFTQAAVNAAKASAAAAQIQGSEAATGAEAKPTSNAKSKSKKSAKGAKSAKPAPQ